MKKILLIEDNRDMLENTAEILQLANYEVLTALNGKEGIAIAQKENPDLIICDIMMPVLDGYGVLHLLSKNEETASIPFIFLTAKAEKSELRKGMEMGADDYLTKPFDDIELLNAVETRLKKSEVIRHLFSKSQEGLSTFFNDVKDWEELKKLADDRKVKPYRKKENVYTEDQYPNSIFQVVKGKIKTCITNDQGKELITGLYKPGDFFGYLSLLENQHYHETATALEEAEVCHIPKEDFLALINQNPKVSRRFIKILSDNVREKEEQLIKLAYDSVRKRVAEALITLYQHYKDESAATFSTNISREDLAKMAGTATETTIRTLSSFKDEGLIDIKEGAITILNYPQLTKMKN